MGRSPVETVSVVAKQPSHPCHQTQRHGGRRDLHAPQRADHDTRSTLAPRGHGHRTSHGIQTSIPSPGEAASSRPTHRSPARRPSNAQPRHATPRGNPIAAFPRAASASTPTPSRLGGKDSPTVACAQGPRKLFRRAQGAPRKTQARPRFASSLAPSLSRRRHPHHKARQGGGPRREEADSHGKEHRREVARGDPRVPGAQGRRGPGGGLGARPGRHRLHRHERRGVRLTPCRSMRSHL